MRLSIPLAVDLHFSVFIKTDGQIEVMNAKTGKMEIIGHIDWLDSFLLSFRDMLRNRIEEN